MRNEKVIGFIEKEMALQRLNRSELARRSKLSRSTISKILNGDTPFPEVDTLVAIARGLGKPDNTLLVLGGHIKSPKGLSPEYEEINMILSQLPPEEREDILEYARMRVRINERRGNYAADPSLAET